MFVEQSPPNPAGTVASGKQNASITARLVNSVSGPTGFRLMQKDCLLRPAPGRFLPFPLLRTLKIFPVAAFRGQSARRA